METHTIRWNGDKTHRIVTFRPDFEKQLLEAHPRAATVTVDRLLKWLKQETGTKHTLDSDQIDRLQYQLLKCDGAESSEHYYIDKWIVEGVRIMDANLEVILKCLSIAYGRLEGV